ncbi:G-rich sequence factor 1-like [Sitodiplosis mosellana]|uniref:G-rich sequence factor 1-like n=1 Tax=Sitodiplosis mosellana TaxID=263140 RepID=UPI002443E5DC|nr:G-rich sequence factor 1-like [Sitodiplosis mosellana]
MDVEQLNIEIGVFLKRLRMYSERKNAQINEKTVELLSDAVLHIDYLITNAEIIATAEHDSVKFLFDLNEQQFDLRQYIVCRLCVEQIGLSKDDLEAHLQRNIHAHKQHQQAMVNGNGLPAIATNRKASVETNGAKDMTMDSEYKTVDKNTKYPVTMGFMTGGYIKVEETPSVVKVVGDSGSASKTKEPAQFDYDSTYLIRASKIPWVATKEEILDFFDDINILNGINGIHFIVDKTKNSCNDALIQLASEKDYRLAMNLKVIRMGFSSVKISQANMIEFIFLISKSSYPAEQRALRLENLPPNCSTMEIKNYFNGCTILKVHLVLDKSQRQTGEAFVMFANIYEVELALRQMDGKKIRKTLVKAFRSSEEQFRHYCDNASVTAYQNPQIVPNSMPIRVNSVPDLSPKKRAIHSSTISLKMDDGVYRILARGFPWQVKPEDVSAFFQNVIIVGGRNGIHIKKNGAMEATFFVSSKEFLNKALAHDKQQYDSRTIHVSQIL